MPMMASSRSPRSAQWGPRTSLRGSLSMPCHDPHSAHHLSLFSEGNWDQAPHSSVPWGVHSCVPKGLRTRGEGCQEPMGRKGENTTRPAPTPNESRALLLLAASSRSPVSQNHSSLLAFAHTRRLPGTPFQMLLTTQPVSEFQTQHWPTYSCKCSWTRCTLSSDCTPDKYSIIS